ncbi:hypothetical protein EPA93_40290 [Ktedonosporobacter rubrisoli]|uniref:Uncharacterized protein n=1 Tax=Ktedonosporobacter rubrisoli TaxID=2509675 RepID=A0A4P6K323_KTERU|nr:hypothetical protein [Ktedonosporobacter rubrisoli]QBD81886.1 hypothetical protein EPA93_40290 [Ktedonosporobacter rubrisoli]
MDFHDENFEAESEEIGSDELLADDRLRLPEDASILVRVHAVRAWLLRRQKETGLEVGEAALALQQLYQDEAGQVSRLRQRELQKLVQREQQQLEGAQQRLKAFEEAQELLEESLTHTTTGERALVEYYLTLDDLLNPLHEEEEEHPLPWRQALAEVQHRVEHVGTSREE